MLEKLAEKHEDWVGLVKKLGCNYTVAEDVVQELYLRLDKYREKVESKVINEDGEVNTFYVFVTLRNLLRDVMNIENGYVDVEEWLFEEADNEVDFDAENAHLEIMKRIKSESNSWGPYHSKLFNLYYMTDYSMRDIANGTDIGLTHIYNNLKSYREIIVDKIGEDYQDYLNKDYEQI
jgi:DNA-directed RNA polymerase specialized sigma24 family protein